MLKHSRFSAIIIVFSLILVIFLIIIGFSVRQKAEQNDTLRLTSYKNTVALYRGEELIKTYNDIVLNVLPEPDRQRFASGISVASEEEAERILEDYDG